MAKTIKFNLMVDGHPARTLNDLREHFNIEDVLECHKNGLLLRWLQVREYQKQAEQVAAINETEDEKIVNALVAAFEMDAKPEHLQEAVHIIRLKKEHQVQLKDLQEKEFKRNEAINAYHREYTNLLRMLTPDSLWISRNTYNALVDLNVSFKFISDLIDKKYLNISDLLHDVKKGVGDGLFNQHKYQILRHIEKDRKNFGEIKATVNYLIKEYYQLLSVDIIRFYDAFIEYEPLVMIAVLMNKNARNLFFDKWRIKKKLSDLISWDFLNLFPVKIFGADTSPFWKDIEPTGTEYLIIRIEQGKNFVRNLGKQGEELSYLDVNSQFPILDGIDYKSDNANHKLVYLPCSPDNPFWTGTKA